MMKKLAIINRLSCRVKENIRKGLDADIVFTEYPGHAETIARDSSGYDIIIAVGGDGTISEIVNGMVLENQFLAILPLGTGNSLARDLGIGTLARAFDIIRRQKRKRIDLLRCKFENGAERRERYAVTTTGIGFASAVAGFGNHYLKMAGPFCYPLSACFKSVGQEVIAADIRIDDQPPQQITFTNFFVNNTRHAGNARVFPRADLADSLLNLFFARTNAVIQYFWNISVITKTYFYRAGERCADRVHIKLRKPSSFMLDGEIFDSVEEIRYSIIPRALNVLI